MLLDTSIVIELFKGNLSVANTLVGLETVNIPFAVLGELYLGAYRSLNPKKHIDQISAFLTKCNILLADSITADNYALIKADLLTKGKPIPENDIWIAAVARQHDLILFTKDKHFKEIGGLILEEG
ncbi:type II toxin-antitoxin system VapC family toxin [Mucilaginibacter sp. L3T2-6]|uniref:type II toxin-antitoxin system VapC family toxin n=1 Tax=Mucilaginibacter sp. L3T2-6 TaxID=3062491 RepID=UPI00267762BD|nr:type II toxin-antitoxin system VapC family toxin [Mucilaginibacter sp. L3T2-6]MDO3642614.1 type II toxin-antitoxin system VapC family toxin [Mucilaginibacter sp. L3T2-6]